MVSGRISDAPAKHIGRDSSPVRTMDPTESDQGEEVREHLNYNNLDEGETWEVKPFSGSDTIIGQVHNTVNNYHAEEDRLAKIERLLIAQKEDQLKT